jgi:hypothetical protein
MKKLKTGNINFVQNLIIVKRMLKDITPLYGEEKSGIISREKVALS